MTQTGSIERKALEIFSAALELPSTDRTAWAIKACEGDELLEARVRALLAADGSGNPSLKTGGARQDAGEDPQPERAGAYRITKLIGRGGMGAVYMGERDAGDFEHLAAIKIVRPGVLSDTLVERFGRERQILANLNHPHIARLLDGGTLDNGSPYIVMEYIDGEPISDWANEHGLSVDRRLGLFSDLCHAVQHAHQNLVVHRDITPTNVLVTKEGSVKLIDFGIAKPHATDSAPDTSSISSGSNSLASLSFTPGFAAPERAAGAPTNTLSDVYSLGKLLTSLLEGVGAHDHAELGDIIAMATRETPADRYASVDALLEDVSNFREGHPVDAHAGGVGYRLSKFVSRQRIAVTLGSLAVLGLVGALAVTAYQYNRAETSLVRANERFEDARGLSRALLFDVYDSFAKVSGTLEPRKAMAGIVKDYVDVLAADEEAPADVQQDVGTMQLRLSDLYGGIGVANFGDTDISYDLLLSAERALENVVSQSPENIEATAELTMVKRMLTMQLLNYKLDTDAATAKNLETTALAESGLSLASEDQERPILRHLWSARTDKLQILLEKRALKEASDNVSAWRGELNDEMFARLGGGEEMAAYLAAQEGEILLEQERGQEALEPLKYAENYRRAQLVDTPDSYYNQTQLMVALTSTSRAYRQIGNAAESVAFATEAVALARQIASSDPSDEGGRESIGSALRSLTRAEMMAGNTTNALKASEESLAVFEALETVFPDGTFYKTNVVYALALHGQVQRDLEQNALACSSAQQARQKLESIQEDDGATTSKIDLVLRNDINELLEGLDC